MPLPWITKQLEALVVELSKPVLPEPFSFEGLFDFDNLADAMQQAINAKSIELVVMGTNGATMDAEEVIFGSNTCRSSVMCNAHPSHSRRVPFWIPLKILFTYKGKIISIHRHFSCCIPSSIRKVSLRFVQGHHESAWSWCLGSLFRNYLSLHEGMGTAEAVNACEQLLPVQMHVVSMAKPKSLFQRIFSGSELSKISYQSRIPLWCLNNLFLQEDTLFL